MEKNAFWHKNFHHDQIDLQNADEFLTSIENKYMLLQYKSQSQLQVPRHNIYSVQFYVAA